MKHLTLERVFSAPDLAGSPPQAVRFSPDGRRVTYLKENTGQARILDLWQYSLDSRTESCLVAAAQLEDAGRVLSDVEKAMRERKRISQSGIVEYAWSPDGTKLLFPVQGNLYLFDITSHEVTALTTNSTHESHAHFSPDGQHVSFIRDQDLWVLPVERPGDIRRLTTDGGGLVSNGVPEFIAQEEMHRFEGYWWSPDGTAIAFLRVDESPVETSTRYEIDADDFQVFEQRYPFAGTANACVAVRIVSLADGKTSDLGEFGNSEHYLARLNWLPDSEHVAIQVQDRRQQVLRLLKLGVASGKAEQLLEETSDSWINLHDNLRFLGDGRFIWSSERDGFSHLYLHQADGALAAQLTRGNWQVARLRGVLANGDILFDGFADTPLEKHLYLAGAGRESPERLTAEGAWHETILAPRAHRSLSGPPSAEAGSSAPGIGFLDTSSSPTRPTHLELVRADGTHEVLFANDPDQPEHPFYSFRHVQGEIEFGTIAAEDGQALHYRIMRPRGAVNVPVIVNVYGGPGVQRVTRQWQPAWCNYLLQQGYALFQLDNRGSSNRGKTFESPIYRQLGKVEVADQVSGILFLKTLDWVDPTKIGVFGHSYGGYMTLLLLALAPGLVRAGVSVAPVTDWRLYDTHYTERYMDLPDANTSGYQASSVFSTLPGLADDLLVIHGMADDNVLFTHSTRLFRALQAQNKPFEIMTYPGSKHSLAERDVSIHRYGVIERFFARTLDVGRHQPEGQAQASHGGGGGG